MKIIFGTDFTKRAAQAGLVAAFLTARLEGELWVIHALEPPAAREYPATIRQALLAEAEPQLELETARLGGLGVKVQSEVHVGAADEVILERAQALNADLIAVASLGWRAPERWLLGSVSERIAESAPIPTLVVRNEQPILEWPAGAQPLRVLCACDFTPAADAALAFVKVLRRAGTCDVVAAQVTQPVREKRWLGIPGPAPLDANLPEVQAALERNLSERAREVLGGEPPRIRVQSGWSLHHLDLIEMARSEQAHVIVTGARQWHGVQRLWHASTSRGLLHEAPVSVLIVPASVEQPASSVPDLRRVLAATDLTASAARVLPHACAALPQGGTIKFIHVVAPLSLPGPLVPHYDPKPPTRKHQRQRIANSLRKLQSQVPAQAAGRGIVVEPAVLEASDIAACILQAGERFGAHLICLGSRRYAKLAKKLLGSVAQEVVARSSRPVLVIPEESI